jgi:hypothetical protein
MPWLKSQEAWGRVLLGLSFGQHVHSWPDFTGGSVHFTVTDSEMNAELNEITVGFHGREVVVPLPTEPDRGKPAQIVLRLQALLLRAPGIPRQSNLGWMARHNPYLPKDEVPDLWT